MTSSQLADIQYGFFLCPMLIFAAQDVWILRALTEAALVEVPIVGSGHACILLCLTRLQFCGKLLHQWLDRLKTCLGIGIFRIEISDDARVLVVAQPIVIIDAHTAECREPLWHDGRNWGSVCRRLHRVGLAKWQPAGERNRASRKTECEMPSSEQPRHKNESPSGPSGASSRWRMRHL